MGVHITPPTWRLASRELSRWTAYWYGINNLAFVYIEQSQFALSGETESFSSLNNLMGQWLKFINGYTVEQIGDVVHDPCLMLTTNLACCFRLESVWSDSSSYRINLRVCNCNKSKWRSIACLASVHGSRLPICIPALASSFFAYCECIL